MKTLQTIFFLYSTLPFLAIWIPSMSGGKPNAFSSISFVSIVRIIALIVMARLLSSGNEPVHLSGVLVNGYPMDFILKLDVPRACFLLTAELCFLLAHWICRINTFNIATVNPLLFLVQGFCSILVTAENTVASGGIMVLNGIVFFYLIRFSMPAERKTIADKISRSVYLLFFIIGLLMIMWGITEFGEKDLRFTRGSGSLLGIVIWITMLVLSVPLTLWAKWFNSALECLPEGVALALVTFLCSVTLKMSSIYSSAYPDLDDKYKRAFYILGIVGGAFSLSELFSAKTRRNVLASFPGFFLSLILVSVGVSQTNIVNSVFYVCMFVPVFTALVLYGSSMKVESSLHRAFIVGMLILVLGFPGTPVYLIFSTVGARSIDMGVGYTIVFGILWFLYFCANVHVCRKLFMSSESNDALASSSLSIAPKIFTSYCLFLMFFIVLITHFAGGFL